MMMVQLRPKCTIRHPYLHCNSNHQLEHKRGVVKIILHSLDTISDDKKDKVEEKSHTKQAPNMNGYPNWLINSIPLTQPSLEV